MYTLMYASIPHSDYIAVFVYMCMICLCMYVWAYVSWCA